MRSVIERDRKREEEMFYVQAHMKTLVLYTPYLDGLAKLIGCKPRLWTYVYNPPFLHRLLFGSNVSASYRLRGPHKNPTEAKRIIMHLPAVPMRPKNRARQISLALYSRIRSFVGAH
jgi:dimethylaniline monooxygenase (N-oxide forming)